MGTAIHLGELTILQISGADRIRIANNLCTQDLKSIEQGQSVETFVTDVKGRILCHGLMVASGEALLFVAPPGFGDRLVPHFDRYILREDAVPTNRSAEFDAFLFESPETLQGLFSASAIQQSSDEDSIQFAAPWIGMRSVILLVRKQDSSRSILDILKASCIRSDCHSREHWERLRVDSFWPWYGVDCDDKNLPQELAIDERAISFKKGCYLGQETVARLDALGQVQKKLVRLEIEGKAPFVLPHNIVIDSKEIGVITSAARTESGWTALAMLRRSHFAAGTTFSIDGRTACVIR